MRSGLAGFALFATCLFGSDASGLSIAVLAAPGAVAVNEGVPGSTRGYAFTPTRDVVVYRLGYWDDDGDGNAGTHGVGIWDADMDLIVSATVQAGTLSPSLGGAVEGGRFRYESVAPTLLLAGVEYVIGGQSVSGDRFLSDFDDAGSATTDLAIAITDFERAHFGSFDFPDFSGDGNTGNFGPNFVFVAEPGLLVLLALAGVALRGTPRTRP